MAKWKDGMWKGFFRVGLALNVWVFWSQYNKYNDQPNKGNQFKSSHPDAAGRSIPKLKVPGQQQAGVHPAEGGLLSLIGLRHRHQHHRRPPKEHDKGPKLHRKVSLLLQRHRPQSSKRAVAGPLSFLQRAQSHLASEDPEAERGTGQQNVHGEEHLKRQRAAAEPSLGGDQKGQDGDQGQAEDAAGQEVSDEVAAQ